MNFNLNQSIDKTNAIMNLIAKRQQTIGSNLANVNTPGYVRQDVNFEQYLGILNSPLETKLSKKMGSSPLINKDGGEVSPSAELLAMQKNMLMYTMSTRRVSALIQTFKTVAQVGK
ncbi:MAG: flagellar basal body protein [Bacillus subtilis]|nr:flagellar basal body protein [Bacillus subtilis]